VKAGLGAASMHPDLQRAACSGMELWPLITGCQRETGGGGPCDGGMQRVVRFTSGHGVLQGRQAPHRPSRTCEWDLAAAACILLLPRERVVLGAEGAASIVLTMNDAVIPWRRSTRLFLSTSW
jgi:hypothetical protein